MTVSKEVDSDGDLRMVDLTGVHALANAMAANGSLTVLDVCENVLGDEGKALLRQAVA